MCSVDDFIIYADTPSLLPLFTVGRAVRSPLDRIGVCLVSRGTADVEIDGVGYQLRERTLLVVTPSHLLQLLSRSSDFRCSLLSFLFDLLSDVPLLLKREVTHLPGDRPCIQLDGKAAERLSLYHTLMEDCCGGRKGGDDIVKGLLYAYLVEIKSLFSEAEPDLRVTVTRRKILVDDFFRLLHTHFRTERTAVFYASRLYVSDKHLMRCIKQETGRTFSNWVADFVVREAKLSLLSADMNVMQIAAALHFPDSSSFARFFIRHTGVSPTVFRSGATDGATCL